MPNPFDKVVNRIQSKLVNISPRILDEEFDKQSLPQKMLNRLFFIPITGIFTMASALTISPVVGLVNTVYSLVEYYGGDEEDRDWRKVERAFAIIKNIPRDIVAGVASVVQVPFSLFNTPIDHALNGERRQNQPVRALESHVLRFDNCAEFEITEGNLILGDEVVKLATEADSEQVQGDDRPFAEAVQPVAARLAPQITVRNIE